MSAHYAKEWLEPRDNAETLVSLHRKPNRASLIARGLEAIRDHARERRELSAMSDGELRDIGIGRSDVDRVFGPAFAREYARRGDFRLRQKSV